MGGISENFMLSRNRQLENQAIESIITLFAANETQSKNEQEIMALVLDAITAACDVVPRQDNDDEARKLQEFNSKLEHYIKQFRGEEAATIKNCGKDLSSCVATLKRIRQSLREEPDGDWMEKRMTLFIDGLTIIGERLVKKRMVSVVGLGIVLFGFLLELLDGVFLDLGSSGITVFTCLVLVGGGIYVYGKYIM